MSHDAEMDAAMARIGVLRYRLEQADAENARLKAEVEWLTKAGDAIYQSFDQYGQVDATTLKGWQAAKDKQP